MELQGKIILALPDGLIVFVHLMFVLLILLQEEQLEFNPHLQQVLLNHHLQKHRHPRLLSLHNQWKVRVQTIFLSKETDKMMRSSTMRDNQLKTAFFRSYHDLFIHYFLVT